MAYTFRIVKYNCQRWRCYQLYQGKWKLVPIDLPEMLRRLRYEVDVEYVDERQHKAERKRKGTKNDNKKPK